MKTQDIIRDKRIAKGFTQREVAEALGVSAAAVNKWEQGKSYPDITLLSPLARLLETDLNHLLAFHKNLTDSEIGERLKQLTDCYNGEGIEIAFKQAKEIIQAYPNSEHLIFNIAVLFEGLLAMDSNNKQHEEYRQEISLLYQRIARTTDETLRFEVAERIFHLCLDEGELTGAETLLADLPTNVPDVTFLKAILAKKQTDYFRSSQLLESNLILLLSQIQQHLSLLIANALSEKNHTLAHEYAKAASQLTKTFQLWEYNQYTFPLEIAIAEKNQAETIRLIAALLKSSQKPWKMQETSLYSHLPTKEIDHDSDFFKRMLSESFLGNSELDYVQENPDFKALFN